MVNNLLDRGELRQYIQNVIITNSRREKQARIIGWIKPFVRDIRHECREIDAELI
jgi:hypothetical protein